MKTQFEVLILDSLSVWLTIAGTMLIIKVGALDGARLLADYSLALAVGWGVAVVVGTMLALLNYFGAVGSVPMLITLTSDGFMILNLRNKQERQFYFKQLVAYQFIEGVFTDKLKIVLDGKSDQLYFLCDYEFYTERKALFCLDAYNFYEGKAFRSMLQAFEEAVSRYNQHNDERHIIRRDAPFVQGKLMWTVI